jgi:predicted Ser/Thr protein kinase
MSDKDKVRSNLQTYKRIPPRILRGKMPVESFALNGKTYRLEKILKQDFFAATGRYVGPDGADGKPEKAVLKHYHTEPWLGIWLEWTGVAMCKREVRHYRLLEDLAGIPKLLGRVGKSAFAHAWVEGDDLLDVKDVVPDDFFDRLEALVGAIHDRGMAYVDMNKPDNVLVGPGGQPFLIDFQISYLAGPRCGRIRRRILAALQREDMYHVRKLKRKIRRDLMTPEEIENSYRRSRLLRFHRLFGAPLRDLRRKILDHLKAR